MALCALSLSLASLRRQSRKRNLRSAALAATLAAKALVVIVHLELVAVILKERRSGQIVRPKALMVRSPRA
jgi:hypothetical protein